MSRFDGNDWTTFTTDDGLVDNTVNGIVEAMDGAIWFTTLSGVSRSENVRSGTAISFRLACGRARV